MLSSLKKEIQKKANPEKARILQGFFKTGKGEYGEGDIFLGLTVPQSRLIVKKFAKEISLKETEELLHSKFHEERLIALLILVNRFEKNSEEREKIVQIYLKNTKWINNWDLVDLSAPNIVGRYILEKGGKNSFIEGKIFDLASSEELWEKRISIVATHYFIRNGRFAETLKISKILLKDKHDLIHKAIGWMLREVWKRDNKLTEDFLKENYYDLPRTTLRYAIEKMDEEKRKKFLYLAPTKESSNL